VASQRLVIVDDRFGRFERSVEEAVGRALQGAARDGIEAAKAKNTRGYRIGGIVAAVGVSTPRRGPRGLDVAIMWRDFRAIFFEKGTYRNRRGKLSARTQRAEGSAERGGVQPVRFMAAARRAARATMIEHIKREIRL
jgi:hypothetical protein